MSAAKEQKRFRWRTRAEEEIPDGVPVLIVTGEFESPCVAESDGDYLFGGDGDTLDWEQIRWWARIPLPPP